MLLLLSAKASLRYAFADSICAEALLRKSEAARAILLRLRAARKTGGQAQNAASAGFSEPHEISFRQFEKKSVNIELGELTMLKIIVDAMGGDHAPAEIVKGAVESLADRSDFKVILTGDEALIKHELDK